MRNKYKDNVNKKMDKLLKKVESFKKDDETCLGCLF